MNHIHSNHWYCGSAVSRGKSGRRENEPGRSRGRTRITNHSVLSSNSCNLLFARFLTIVPCYLVLFCHTCKFRIQPRILFVIRLERLTTMSTEPVFVQRVNVYRSTNLMYCAKIFKLSVDKRGCWMEGNTVS